MANIQSRISPQRGAEIKDDPISKFRNRLDMSRYTSNVNLGKK